MPYSVPLATAPAPGQPETEARSCAPSHLRAVLHGMKYGLFTFDEKLRVLFSSDRLGAMLEIPAGVMARPIGVLPMLETSLVLDDTAVQQAMEACLAAVATPDAPVPALVIAPGDGTRAFALEIGRTGDGSWAAAFEEITSRRAAEAQALERALRDPLTGLANRQLFTDRVATVLAGDPVPPGGHVLVLVDLDRFKAVNDTLGHPVGDTLLCLVAQRLRSALRQAEVVARLGGDEFAMLLTPAPDRDALARLGRRIVDLLGRPYLIEGHLVNIGASVGMALAPQDGHDHGGLFKSADLALYHSKSSGRNTFAFFAPEMDARANARRLLEIDLRKALTLREFELHYQPQIALDANRPIGFEALLRWRHPDRGLLAPAEFIPLAEEIGLIVPLGEWVLREACREAMRWPGEIGVAVNVSPRQFEDCDRLVDVVTKVLAATGLPGSRLEVEITEGVLLRASDDVLATLHRLRAMGVRVAMDDFGTGYSSLSQLRAFPFDKIKIDRSFVRDLGDDGSRDAVIRAIAALGVSLGMQTIAEGVETPTQLDRIRSEGCTSVQGYLFSKPVPATEVGTLIADLAARRVPSAA